MNTQLHRNFHAQFSLTGIMGWLIALTVLLHACSEKGPKPTTAAPKPPTPQAPSPVGTAVTPGTDSDDMKLTTLSLADFQAKFYMHAKPIQCEIPDNFYKEVDPKLTHFERVEIDLGNGKRSEIAMQNFGAWAMWKNSIGNYEMLTTMVNDIGYLMHLSTYSPEFKPLGSFEVARRSNFKGQESIKRGQFSEGDNYSYTVVIKQDGKQIQNLSGLVIVAPSGNYKVMNEVE